MRSKILSCLLCFIMVFSLFISVPCLNSRAAAAKGIYNNGLNGIYIDVNAAPYTTFMGYSYGGNAYTSSGCAWFASARVNQLTGKGNVVRAGTNWWREAGNLGYSKGSSPKAKSIVCYSNHVAVLEAIVGDSYYISEGGYGSSNPSFWSQYGYTRIAKLSYNELINHNGTGNFFGFVYFGNTSGSDSYVSSIKLTTVANQGCSITLNWDQNSKYGVYIKRGTNSGNTVQVAKVTSGKTYTDWNLDPSKTYYYYVQDIRADGKSGVLSNGVQIATTPKLTAEYSNGVINFTWKNNTNEWKTQTLNRTNMSTNKSENLYSFSSTSTTLTKSVNAGTVGTVYRYWVQPINHNGQGAAYSNYVYTYSLTYDSNNGSAKQSVWGMDGGKFPTISNPVKSGYDFKGWYTAKTGGTKVSMPLSVGTTCQTVYAQWTVHTHSYGAWTTTKAATCTASGTKTRTCNLCGNKETGTIAATGHTSSDWIIDKAAKIGVAGTKHKECKVCKAVLETAAIDALKCTHSYEFYKTEKDATCTESGTDLYICSICEDIKKYTVDATGHSYSDTWQIEENPTCIGKGIEARYCSFCDEKQTRSITETGHTPTDWIIDNEAQVNKKGMKHTECAVCHKILVTEIIEEIGGDITEEPSTEFTEEPSTEFTEEPSTEFTEEPSTEFTEEPSTEFTEEPSTELTEDNAPINLSKCNVSLSKTSYAYNGKTKKPNVTVKYGNNILIKDRDYTVIYSNNKEIGTAKVTIAGKGNYTGKIIKTFKITPAKQKITNIKRTQKGFKVFWRKKALKTISGYQVRYSKSYDMSNSKKITVKNKSCQKEIKGINRYVFYYVQVRAYKTMNGKKVYGEWSDAWIY